MYAQQPRTVLLQVFAVLTVAFVVSCCYQQRELVQAGIELNEKWSTLRTEVMAEVRLYVRVDFCSFALSSA